MNLSERRASSQGPGDEARSCHCCLNRSATVRQKLQQAGMVLFAQACSFVATLLTKKNPMAIVRVHAEVGSRCATRTHARAHVHIWYVVVSDHAHFAASILYLTRPIIIRVLLGTGWMPQCGRGRQCAHAQSLAL